MRFEKQIYIEAPAGRVWDVMSDVTRWSEWTASITSVQIVGDVPLGEGARVRVIQPKLPAAIWRVTAWEPGRYFAWRAGAPAIMDAYAEHRVEPSGTGAHVTLTIDQKGFVTWFFGKRLGKLTDEYTTMEAEGLKRRCEEGVS